MDSRFSTNKPRPAPSAPVGSHYGPAQQQYQPAPQQQFGENQPPPPPYVHNPPATLHSEAEDHGKEARAELARYGLGEHHEAQICIVLDVSSSMDDVNHQFYSSGTISRLISRAMGIAIELSPGQNHSVTIFPFGAEAFNPIVIEEKNVDNAVYLVLQSINNQLSGGTNYNLAIEKVRRHYFGSSARLKKPEEPYPKPPVFCLFVTDGDANAQKDEARIQFACSEHNAIFIKFIALRGTQANLQFGTLNLICNNNVIPKGGMPNKHLEILDNPDQLTMRKLFYRYRTWLEEAKEHDILLLDPHINLDIKNPDDAQEIAEREEMEEDHGHEDLAGKHGHADEQASNSNAFFNQRARQRSGDTVQLHLSAQAPRNQRYSCC